MSHNYPHISVSLPKDLLTRLDQSAKNEMMSRSGLIIQILKSFFDFEDETKNDDEEMSEEAILQFLENVKSKINQLDLTGYEKRGK